MLLHKGNVNVVSLTFDGLSTNLTMAKQLSCCFDDHENIKSFFPHPGNPEENIVIFPDYPSYVKINEKYIWREEKFSVKWYC